MRFTFAGKLSLVLLLSFVMGAGNLSFMAERLVHEYEHGVNSRVSASAQDTAGRQQTPEKETDLERVHAGCHVQPCPTASFDWHYPATAPAIRSTFITIAVREAVGDPPFRPPRGLSELA